jgi:tRNA 2-selenouridine synthase
MSQPRLASFPPSFTPEEIIDVRSPAEYEEDHILGAVNLPVLSNAEREQVGTIYKQQSAFEAKRIGAAMISENIAQHLRTHFADKPKYYEPLLYCARGGQRSHSLASVLHAVGWKVHVLDGGYKTYRRHVLE